MPSTPTKTPLAIGRHGVSIKLLGIWVRSVLIQCFIELANFQALSVAFTSSSFIGAPCEFLVPVTSKCVNVHAAWFVEVCRCSCTSARKDIWKARCGSFTSTFPLARHTSRASKQSIRDLTWRKQRTQTYMLGSRVSMISWSSCFKGSGILDEQGRANLKKKVGHFIQAWNSILNMPFCHGCSEFFWGVHTRIWSFSYYSFLTCIYIYFISGFQAGQHWTTPLLMLGILGALHATRTGRWAAFRRFASGAGTARVFWRTGPGFFSSCCWGWVQVQQHL